MKTKQKTNTKHPTKTKHSTTQTSAPVKRMREQITYDMYQFCCRKNTAGRYSYYMVMTSKLSLQ